MKKEELEALVKKQHEKIQDLEEAVVTAAGRSMGDWVREVEERLGADYQRLAGELKRTQAELAAMTARARTAESEQERDLAAQKKLADDHRKIKNEHKSCPTASQLEKAERERNRLKTQNEKLELVAQKLRDGDQAWKTERAQLLLDIAALRKAHAEDTNLKEKYDALEQDKAGLEAQCAQLSEDKKNLEQENARLTEEKALLSSNGSLALQNADARVRQLTADNAALAESKRRVDAVVEVLRTQLAKLNAAHNQNCADMRELAEDLAAREARLQELTAKEETWNEEQAKMAGMQTRIDTLEEREHELARARERLDALRSVEKELRDCEEELAGARARIEPVEGRLQEALNHNAQLAAHAQEESRQLEQARRDLEQVRRGLAAMQTKNASLALYGLQESQLRQAAAQQDPQRVQNLETQLAAYVRVYNDAHAHNTMLTGRLNALEQTKAQYDERVQQYVAALNERDAQLAPLQNQLQQTQNQLAQLQNQLAQTQNQLAQTQAQLQQTTAQLTQVQNQLADTQGQLGQAQGAEKVTRSQESQTGPVLVLRLSRKELEEREAAKQEGVARAQIEDNKALVRVEQTDPPSDKVAELTAERDELLDRLKGLDVVQVSMQEQLDAANRTTSVLRGEIARLNEIRYTTSAAKTGDASTPKPTLGPSNAVNVDADAGPSNPGPTKATSPGSKENAAPQAGQSSSSVAPETVFGRVVLQCLRNMPWPSQGHMWINMMAVLAPDSQVPLHTVRDAFVRDAGTPVDVREFGEMILSVSAALFPGMVRVAGGFVSGLALRESGAAEGGQRPAAPIPVTPRGPPAILATPRSALPTPATAPRPPAPAGPRPLPPPRMGPPVPPQTAPLHSPRTAPLPPPRTAPPAPPRTAQPAPPRAVPPAAPPSSPTIKTEPGVKRRVAEGEGTSERPVKRPRFGNALSSSPAPPSSPGAVASSPTDRIASGSRAAAHKPLSRVAAPAKVGSPAQTPSGGRPSGTAKPAAPASSESPSMKPKPTPSRTGAATQPAQTSSPGQVAPPRAGPSSSSQPASVARATPATPAQSPPPLHPEHRRQAVWDIDKSDVEDLFVLWLRQGALRDISSHLPRNVAIQRAADALRRIGWASADGASFVVPATSREYRYARFGKLTIAKALGFIDF